MPTDSHHMAHLILSVLHPMMYRMVSDMRPIGHPSQFAVLGLIDRRGPCTLSEIAEYQGVSLPGASSLANTLEERGWVQRVRDTEDRRVVRVCLTETGCQTYTKMQSVALNTVATALESLNQADQEIIQKGLILLEQLFIPAPHEAPHEGVASDANTQ